MSDFIIPKHKRLTGKAKLQAESERAVKHLLETTCKDRLLLLSIVTGGKAHWRGIAGKAFQGFLVNDDVIDQMFGFLVEQAGPDPTRQFEELQRAELVSIKLDRLQGLSRFIHSEKHMDEVLDRWVPDGAEKAAIRSQLLLYVNADKRLH